MLKKTIESKFFNKSNDNKDNKNIESIKEPKNVTFNYNDELYSDVGDYEFENYDNQIVNTPTAGYNIYDNKPYVFNGKQYHYLEDDKINQIFGMCTNDNINTFQIHFCIYSIFGESYYPFINYIFENKSGNYTFPSISLSCPNTEDIDTYFKNECVKFVMDFLINTNITPEQLDNLYKGFIDENDNIYVFFDVTNVDINIKENITTAIMDEIINKHLINNVPVSPIVYNLFYKYNYLIHLLDENGYKVDIPLLLYGCRNVNENIYAPIEYANISIDITGNSDISRINHPVIGNYYYFSSTPINQNNNDMQTFLVFIENCLYVLRDIELDNIENIQILNDNDEEKEYSCVYFSENSLQLWCVKIEDMITIF